VGWSEIFLETISFLFWDGDGMERDDMRFF